jgi:hypothetical protein
MPLNYKILMPKLASYSQKFVNEVFLIDTATHAGTPIQDRDSFLEVIKNPLQSAKIFFGNYAFARDVAQKAGYATACVELLKKGFIYKEGESFWKAFEHKCSQRRIGLNAKNNKGVVISGYDRHKENGQGLLYVLGQRIIRNRRLIDTYSEVRIIKGVGVKIAALICRDLAWAFGCEGDMPVFEKPLLQPVDRWIWRVCKEFWEEYRGLKDAEGSYFLAAVRLTAAAEELGISGIQYNQGTWFFCTRYVQKGGGNLRQKLEELQNGLI